MDAIPLPASVRSANVMFDEPRNLVWCVAQGTLQTVRLMDGLTSTYGGYVDPIAVVPLGDGLSVAVVEADGRLLVAPLDDPVPGSSATIAMIEPAPQVVMRSLFDATSVIVDRGDDLVAVDTGSGAIRVVATGVSGLTGVVGTPTGAYGLREVGGVPTVVRSDLDGQLAVEVATLPSGDWCLAPHPDGAGVLAVDTAGDAAAVHDDGTVDLAVQLLATAPVAITRWGGLLLVVQDSAVQPVEWGLDPGPLDLSLGLAPLYVSGFAEVTFDPAPLGVAPDDVELVVREGPDVGSVSVAQEGPTADGRTRRMLVAGWMPGEYHLVAVDRTSGTELAARRFRVTTLWPDRRKGPPIVSAGVEPEYHLLSWGGAGGITGYIDAPKPASPMRVAVVLIETRQRAYGGTLATATTSWTDHTIGAGESARTYYEEVSYFLRTGGTAGMTIELAGGRILGPVAVDAGWGDLFTYRKGSGFNQGWMSTRDSQARMAADVSAWLMDEADGYDIFKQADAFVFVVRSGSDGPTTIGTKLAGTMFVWGHKAGTSPNFSGKDQATSTLTQGPRPLVVMTDAYPAAAPRVAARTLAHELGHVLDLDDLYDARDAFGDDATPRIANHGDLMATSQSLPHFSLANRLRLGWLKRGALRRFDFSASPSGATVTLRATEDLTPAGAPAGEFAGIEVVRDGIRSYVFEYRRQDAATVGDQSLDGLVASGELLLGTDVSGSADDPGRPPILYLHDDADGDGPILDVGEDYVESDVTDPVRMWDFDVSLDSIGPGDRNRAQVTVSYLGARRPQLVLNPAGRDHRTADIRLVDPFGNDTHVVKGAPNTIRLTIHNVGNVAATDVVTHVAWLPFTVAPGEWKPLPDPPVIATIPAKTDVTIDIPWTPPTSVTLQGVEVEHFCVRAEVERFRNPLDPDRDEITVYDNWAQSNFDTKAVSHGSPSERVRTVVGMANVLTREATYHLDVRQTRGMFRVYLDHAWLVMPEGESTGLGLAYESLVDDPVHGAEIEELGQTLFERPNLVELTTRREPDPESDCCTARLWSGASLALSSGRRTWFEDVRFEGEVVRANAFTSIGGVATPLVFGSVTLAIWSPDDPDAPASTRTDDLVRGEAFIVLPERAFEYLAAGAEVLGCLRLAQTPEHAPIVSEIIRIG